jgi:VPDSG-CTERM exosortase interaction domain
MFTFLFYDGHEDTTFSKIANENFSDNLFWVVDYEDTMATLEVIRRLPGVPDQGSTLLLLMLGLGGLLTYRRQLLREQL